MEPGTSSLVLLPMNLKSIVGQYRGRGPELERGRKDDYPVEAWIL